MLRLIQKRMKAGGSEDGDWFGNDGRYAGGSGGFSFRLNRPRHGQPLSAATLRMLPSIVPLGQRSDPRFYFLVLPALLPSHLIACYVREIGIHVLWWSGLRC